MNSAIQALLQGYSLHSGEDYLRALREIVQKIALLGLWRSKFFEHAAFYGGTALRMIHGLDRFSEDMDFSLLQPGPAFEFDARLAAARQELEAFGLACEVRSRAPRESPIRAGVLRGQVRDLLVAIEAPAGVSAGMHPEQRLKVKLEIDCDPPPDFETEARILLLPVPHSVRVYRPCDLFAGKLHAVLTRRWKSRVKGRDWYDLVWFLGRGIAVRLLHLQRRLENSGDRPRGKPLELAELQELLYARIAGLDITAAREDVEPFLDDRAGLSLWSRDFFSQLIRDHLQAS